MPNIEDHFRNLGPIASMRELLRILDGRPVNDGNAEIAEGLRMNAQLEKAEIAEHCRRLASEAREPAKIAGVAFTPSRMHHGDGDEALPVKDDEFDPCGCNRRGGCESLCDTHLREMNRQSAERTAGLSAFVPVRAAERREHSRPDMDAATIIAGMFWQVQETVRTTGRAWTGSVGPALSALARVADACAEECQALGWPMDGDGNPLRPCADEPC